jgi:hypothetical protein
MSTEPEPDLTFDREPELELKLISERLTRLEDQRIEDLTQLRRELRRFWLALTLVGVLGGVLLGAAGAYLLWHDPRADSPQTASPISDPCHGLESPSAENKAALARIQARFDAGEKLPPLTPLADNGSLSISITSMSQVRGGLQVRGVVRNIGGKPLIVPLEAFRFCDQTGTIYAVPGETKATLQPGQSTELDLTLPISKPHSLVLTVNLPETEQIVQVLLASGD